MTKHYTFAVQQLPEELYYTFERVEDGWDGNLKAISPSTSTAFRVAAAKVEKAEVSSDSSNDEQAPSMERLSRQERKALDREIPWRVILESPPETVELYVEASRKQFASWMSCIAPLTPAKIKDIKNTPSLRRRIIRSRNAKRRTVVLGCQDPDLATLARSSPTPSKMAEMILLQIAVAGMNKLVELTNMSWKLWGGDVSAVFLHGDPEPRSQPLYMRSPRDGVQKLTNMFPDELYEVCGNLYGFASAPRAWWTNVVSTTKKHDIAQYRYDRCFLIKRDS